MKDHVLSYIKIKLLDDDDLVLIGCSTEIIQHVSDFDNKIVFKEDPHNDVEILFMFLTAEETIKVVSIFKSYHLLIQHTDITEHVLVGDVHNKDFIEIFTIAECRVLLDRFLVANLTIDMVLEKITRFGIDSLNDIDKHVLNTVTKN